MAQAVSRWQNNWMRIPPVMQRRRFTAWVQRAILGGCLIAGAQTTILRADQIVYDDALENGWQNWGWATLNYANSSPVHSGGDSISVTVGAWQGIQLWHSDQDSTFFTNLTFWANGGASGGQKLQVYGLLDVGGTNNFALSARYAIGPLPTNSWRQYQIPLSVLGVAGQPNFTGFVVQDSTGAAQPTFYLDDISLVTNAIVASGTNAPVVVAVNVASNRAPISPLIYGTAFASSNQLADLHFTLNRSGGNAETRYNWQLNAHNHAADWYFESLDDGSATPGATADNFVANSKAGGAQPMITIPMIGWAPSLAAQRGKLDSYSIAKYGLQAGNDWQWMPDAGNGIVTNTSIAITNNNPNDANFPTNSAFQRGYVQHLISNWGKSTNGGVRYYFMDNEHSIWFSTHQDVHPVGPTMQEIRGKILDYAGMVKSNDPNALVLGPEEWGWSGYFYSGYDQQNAGQQDRAANGGWDYLPWLLNQLHQHDTNTGQRLLDYFTVHCYPQEGSVGGSAVDAATELLRNQTTRQFWDTNYVDPSWINSVVALIPRMKSWVATNYPGTKIGITEYNWGAEPAISGATAQADILGIFGRQGLDLATRWTTPASNTPTYLAMKIYRNYDGNKSAFGDTSVATTVPNPDNLSAFAAIRTNDSALTVMVVNKTLTGLTPLALSVTNFANSGIAQAWQLTASNVIARLTDVPYAGGVVSNLLPAQSITLFVLPTAKNLRLRLGTNAPPAPMELWLDGQGGQSYSLQASTNLATWTTVGTDTFATNSFRFLPGTTNATRMFYRGVLNLP
jgi:hypothetical protein